MQARVLCAPPPPFQRPCAVYRGQITYFCPSCLRDFPISGVARVASLGGGQKVSGQDEGARKEAGAWMATAELTRGRVF